MPIKTEYVCDQCGAHIEWSYHTVEDVTIKRPTATMDIFWHPEPKKIFCSVPCLAKSLEWAARSYDASN